MEGERRETDAPEGRAAGWAGALWRALPLIAAACAWAALFFLRQPADGMGTDFYPLHRAARALLAGENPYGPAITAELSRTWRAPYAAAGFAYPLPAVVGVLPLLLLPLPLAVGAWLALGVGGAAAAIRLRAEWRDLLFLPLCFMPLHGAAIMKQATLVWFALAVALLFAMRQDRAWLAGFCIALLPAKPQAGILFALAGLVWAWRERRAALAWAAGWALVIWGASFALLPGWVSVWAASVARYNSIVYTASLLPLGLVLIVVTWRLPWYARLAAAQVVLFPMTDVYSALPLLLTWVGVGGPLALFGAALSWLGVALGMSNTIITFWLDIMLPLAICAWWRLYQARRARPAQGAARRAAQYSEASSTSPK